MPTRKRNNGQETSLSAAVRNALTLHGVWCIRVQAGIVPAIYGTTRRFIHCAEPGTPDLLVLFPESGRNCRRMSVGFIEVKTKTGRLSKEQEAWHAKASAHDVHVAVVRSVSEALARIAAWQEQHVAELAQRRFA